MAKLKTLRQMVNRRDLEIVPSRRFRVQPMWRLAFALLFQALFLSGTGWSQPDSPESIRIQLKWKHQFQFAGYYAAIEKGFYAESGLKVELIEREPGTNFVESVLSGHADYGIGDVGLLINRCEGDPIVILAQIFQHSPLAFVSLHESGIISPYEMVGKRAMCDLKGKNHSALSAMMINTIGDLNQIEYVPQSLSLDALVEGKVDICSVYTTNEPFELREKGIDFNLITPQSYGVDFYGDNLFTTENEIHEHPDRVRKVTDATLKGWKYAIENPDEVIDTIIEKYSPGSKREKLAYEAKETLKLIAPELTPLGEINPSRFRTFAQQMATMGVVEEGKVPPGFIFPARLQPAIPLSNEQLEWLEGHPDVSLGFASNFEPLFWLDDQGRQQGVLSDMLDLLNQRLGTRIEVVTADWGDTVDSASMGELDGLLAIPEEMVGQLGMRGTHSYLSLLPTVFAKEGTVNKLKTLSDLRGKKVAVLARVDSLNRLLDPLEGDVEILKGGTARDCLEMVFQGKADATIGFPFYDEAIVRHFFTDIAPAFIFWDKPIQAVIGVRSDWPELVEILNLGIDSITSEKRNQIISKWSSRISEEQVELPRRESEWLARHPVIPVLVPKSSSPFIYTDSEGRERGIYVDFLTALGKRLGVRIQTRSVTFAEYSEEIFDKRSAILAVGPKSEIGEVEGYQWSNPVGYSHTAVFSKTGERRLSMDDLEGRTIGYSSSVSNDTPGFERFLKAKQTIGIDNPDEAISKLLSGEIDGYFDYYPVFNHQLKKAMVSDIEAVYVHPTPISANLLVKDDQGPLLSSVNRAIEAMENEEIPRLLSKWRFTEPAQENKRVHFSVKEDEWISSKPTVRVGADGCLTPVSWVDSRGGVEGMSVDFLDKVSEMTGVRFEFVCSSTWQDLEDMIEAGDVDVIAGLAPTDSKRRTMEFTDPIVSSPAMVFADEDYPVIDDLSELAGSRVGVVGGGAVEEWVSNDFPLLELVPVSNSHEGIVWLGDRKIDVFIGDLLTTTQRIKREGLANIKIVGNTPYKIPRAFGVRKDMNAPLASILRSSLDSMSESERGTIINRWVSVQSDPMIDYSLLWKIGLLAATIVLLVLFMNYRLSKLVTKRTSDLSQANEALRASEASLNRAQEVAHIGSWHWDIAEDRVNWSDEVYRIFGIDKGATITHETFLDRIHPDDRGRVAERVASALRNGSEYEVEHRVIVDGKIRWIRTRAEIERNDLGEAVGALGISHDISDRKSSEEIQERLEEQLRQSQKMEAVGQLAGGVAHDFNNILQAIRGHTDLALQDVPIDSSIREDLEEISEASDRATGLVRQLLAFGRRDNLALGECNLNEAAENLMKMVRRLIGEHIDLVFNPGAEISTIQADRGQIEQIILNLSVNARDAMPEGGTLTIETETRHFDSGFKRENPMAREGTFVALHVKDTGSGIPREILDRIFEPFFTTKEVGKGTGLGLATVYAAVKNHDGFILLDSNRDSGTHFMICFPAAVATASSETSIRKITTIPQSGNGETLLLAEDEKPVRELAVRVLERAGYRVIAAVDGEDAMEKFDTYRDDIEIVIADVVMPKKSGRSVFDHVSAANPTLPFLFMTGHSYNILDSMPASEDRFHLLQKPFSPQELVERVAEVLASRTKTVAV